MQTIRTKRARPASSAKIKIDNDSRQESSFSLALDCLRIAKEIATVSGIFVKGRSQTLLYSC